MSNQAKNTNEIDLKAVLHHVLAKWYWFVLFVGLAVAGGVWYFVHTTPKFTTSASVMLRQKEEGNLTDQLMAFSTMGLGTNRMAEDELVVFSSNDLIESVVTKLDLWEEYYYKQEYKWQQQLDHPMITARYLHLTDEAERQTFSIKIVRHEEGYKITYKMGYHIPHSIEVPNLSAPIELPEGRIRLQVHKPIAVGEMYRIVHNSRAGAIAKYRTLLSVSLYKSESNIIQLSLTSVCPQRDSRFLTTLIEQYNTNALLDKNMLATNTADFIDSRLSIITTELTDAEAAVEQYKREHKIADLSTEAQLFLEGSSDEQKKMAEVQTQIELVDYIQRFISDETNSFSLIPANICIDDPTLTKFIADYNEMLLQRMHLLSTAMEDNPMVAQLDEQLAVMRENILTSIGTVRAALAITHDNLKRRETDFLSRIENVPTQEREYVQVKRQQALKENLYLLLYQKREENALMLAASSTPTKLIDAPRTDPTTGKPKLLMLIIVAVFLGVMMASALVYVLSFFDNKIHDVKEYEQLIDAPCVGQIITNSRGKHIAIREGEVTASAELFRLLRTNLRFLLPSDAKSSVVLVTSCINGEGKSYVSSNMALSLAILGKKVALVGLDIRKPMLAQYFGLSNHGCLTSYLCEDEYTVDDVIVPGVEHPNLDLIPCGVIPPNPGELLLSERLDALFVELRQRYDYIIVDSSPLAMVSDTLLLDRISDITIMVSRAGYTPIEMIDFINQLVEQKRMKNMACVLNGIKSSRAGYGYGYGYGAANKKK